MVNSGGKGRAGRRKGNDSGDEAETNAESVPKVRLELLPAASLRRIKKYFKIQSRAGQGKAAVSAEVLAQLQSLIPLNEKEILTYFIYTVKTNKNRLHNNNTNNNATNANDS